MTEYNGVNKTTGNFENHKLVLFEDAEHLTSEYFSFVFDEIIFTRYVCLKFEMKKMMGFP